MADINYYEQMLNYYPEVIKSIRDYKELIAAQSVEIADLDDTLTTTLRNAYISDADEATLVRWEKVLGITPLEGSTVEDRRETILARLYNTPKLNSESISEIVRIFTGGTAKSYFKDGTIYVLITPPDKSKSYKFDNVTQELRKKIPAHLGLSVAKNYLTWGDVKNKYATWEDVMVAHTDWEDVLYYP